MGQSWGREAAASVIEAQFPDLAPVHVRALGEGCDSLAFLVNDALVFRFPKRTDVERQLLLEMRLLPLVAARVPLEIPAYTLHGEPTPAFPRHFGGYVLIRGTPAIQVDPAAVPFDAIAVSLAQFLTALHTWPVEGAAAAGVPDADIATVIEEVRRDALDDIDGVAAVAPPEALDRWRTYVTVRPAARRSPARAVVHGDLAAEHVLFDSGTHDITGVIDWSDMAVSDPAVDLAGLFHWGGPTFVTAVVAAYGGPSLDDTALALARYLAACRGVADIRFGAETGRPEYVRAGLRALTMCAAHSP